MEGRVRQCFGSWHEGKCRLCHDVKGWGCRLLTFLPDEVPITEHEKACLFVKVYGAAERMGVLQCPKYNELDIDRALENSIELHQMVLLNQPTRADLLSEKFSEIDNYL